MAKPSGGGSVARTFAEAFTANVAPDEHGCWCWVGRRQNKYGHLSFKSKAYRAHRFSYLVFKGPIPDGLYVCHSCDNPLCVNPEHLWLGTNADNRADSVAKRRHARGNTCGKSKLNEDQVCTLVTLVQVGNTQREVAKLFGVTQANVSSIMTNKTWRN